MDWKKIGIGGGKFGALLSEPSHRSATSLGGAGKKTSRDDTRNVVKRVKNHLCVSTGKALLLGTLRRGPKSEKKISIYL